MPWREGITDHNLVASSSSSGSSSSSSSVTSGYGAPGASAGHLGLMVDLSASVSRWLGDGGSSLRDWLLGAVHPLPLLPDSSSHTTPTASGSSHTSISSSSSSSAQPHAAATQEPGPTHSDAHQASSHGQVHAGSAAAHCSGTDCTTAAGGHQQPTYLWPPPLLRPDSGPLAAQEVDALGEAEAEADLLAEEELLLLGLATSSSSSSSGQPDHLWAEVQGSGHAHRPVAATPARAAASQADIALAPPPMRRPHAAAKAPTPDAPAGSLAGSSSSARVTGAPALSPEQLTSELSHADDWRRLAVLLHLHGSEFGAIHMSAAVVRLAKLYIRCPSAMHLPSAPAPATCDDAAAAGGGASLRPGSHSAEVQAHPDVMRLLRSLLGLLPDLMPRVGLRQVSNMLWALGVLRPLLQRDAQQQQGPVSVAGEEADGDQDGQRQRRQGFQAPPEALLLVQKVRQFWRESGPQSLALSLWGMARLGVRPGMVWVEEFVDASAPQLRLFSARQLSYSLWALAALKLRPDAAWLAAAREALAAVVQQEHLQQQQRRSPPQQLGSPAAAAAPLSPAHRIPSRRLPRPAQPSSKDLGLAPPEAVVAAAAAARPATRLQQRPRDPTLCCQSVATTLWACAILHVPLNDASGSALLAAFEACLAEEGPAGVVSAQSLAMGLWGAARAGLRPSQELLAAWQAAATHELLAGASGQALSMMLWALGRLRAAPKGAWVDGCTAALLQRATEGRLGCQAVCNSLGALAALDSRLSGEWVVAFTGACAPLVERLRSDELGVVLNALGRIGLPVDASFLAAAEAAAEAALPAASPTDVAGVAGGLRMLAAAGAGGHGSGAAEGSRCTGAGGWRPGPTFLRSLQGRVLRLHGALTPHQAAECLAALAAFDRGEQAAGTAAEGQCGNRVAQGPGEIVQAGGGASARRHLSVHSQRLVVVLVRQVVMAELGQRDVYDLATALTAAAALGYAPRGPARRCIARAVLRGVGGAPGAKVLLLLLRALLDLHMTPPVAWVANVAGSCGSRLRGLTGEEIEQLLGVLLECGLACGHERQQGQCCQADSPEGQGADSPEGQGATASQAGSQQQAHPVTQLLASTQATLHSCPIQHLTQLAGAVVAALPLSATQTLTAPATPTTAHPEHLIPAGWTQALECATAPRLSQQCLTAPGLVELLACFACLGPHVPGPDWMSTWYDRTAPRLSSLRPRHLSIALRLQGRLGLRPPAAWLQACAGALAVHAASQQLPPVEVLLMASELQRLGYQDHTAGPHAAATPDGPCSSSACAAPPLLPGVIAVATSRLERELAPASAHQQLEVLSALQTLALGFGGGSAAAHAAATGSGEATADGAWAAGALTQPQAHGWVVGVVAMAHDVIGRRPVGQLLQEVCPAPPREPLLPGLGLEGADRGRVGSHEEGVHDTVEETGAAAVGVGWQQQQQQQQQQAEEHAGGPPAVVQLLSSQVRWGHAPSHRWLAGIVRHVAAHSGPDGTWQAADAAAVVLCVTVLGYVPAADVAAQLQANLAPSLGQLPPATVANLCWAWAVVRRPPPAVWWAAATAALADSGALAALPPPLLLRLPWSMAQVGYTPPYEWLLSYLPYVRHALTGCTAAPGCSFAASAAAEPSPDAGMHHGQAGCAAPSAADLANLAWGLGTAVHEGGRPEAAAALSGSGALQALLQASREVMLGDACSLRATGAAATPGELVLLVEGLARMRHRLPQAWVEAFCAQASRQLQACR